MYQRTYDLPVKHCHGILINIHCGQKYFQHVQVGNGSLLSPVRDGRWGTGDHTYGPTTVVEWPALNPADPTAAEILGCVSDINASALDVRRTVQCVPVSQCRRITTAAALHCVHQGYTVAPQTAAYHSVETCLANVLRNFLKTRRYVHGAQNFYIRLYSPRRQHTYRRT